MSIKSRQAFASLIVSIIVLANVGEVRAVELGLVLAIDASDGGICRRIS
jgi:predicted transporter